MPINLLTEEGFGMIVGSGEAPFSFGNALQFDGVNDYVDFTEINVINEFSFSCWFKTNETYQNYLVTNDNGLRSIRITSTTLTIVTTAGGRTFNLASSINLAEWNHVLVTRNTLFSINAYVNSIAVTSSGQAFIGALPLSSFGRRSSLKNQYTLDEVAIWNIDIGNQSVNLYNSGNGDFATNYSDANLIAYWRCNESDGATTLIDEKGTYNGTLNNFSTPPAYFIPH